MAIMIPNLKSYQLNTTSHAERIVYDSLKKLPNSSYVFHSISTSGYLKNDNKFYDGEADFVIFDIYSGIMVIEVKGGALRVENGVWYQTNLSTNGTKKLDQSPYSQAQGNKYALRKLLKKENYKINVPVNYCVWFPMIESLPKNLREDEALITLTRSSLDDSEKSLRKIFNFYNSYNSLNISDAEGRAIVDTISPKFELVQSMKSKMDDLNLEFIRLTNEQSRLLDYLDEQEEACINGAAGTGKTVIAIEKARRLSKEGRVLFLCFNRLLAAELIVNLSDNKQIKVANIHGLFWDISKSPKQIDSKNEDSITEFLMSEEFSNLGFDHIIIDEGQDFEEDHILVLKEYVKNRSGNFYVFYDRNQVVHFKKNNKLNWVNQMECKLKLSINCRNTVQIAETSLSLFEDGKIKKERMIEGDLSTFSAYDSRDTLYKMLKSIISFYTANKVPLEDITIVTLKSFSNSILADVDRIGNYRLSKDSVVKTHVRFTTARKFKGLESNVVIVIDFDDETMSSEENRNSFYVASSRAKINLHILGRVDQETSLKILESLGVESKKNHLPNLIKKLKCKFAIDY